jgi:hypothetical protein
MHISWYMNVNSEKTAANFLAITFFNVVQQDVRLVQFLDGILGAVFELHRL